MFVRLKSVTAVTKKGVDYRLQYADGKLGKGYRLSCDRWAQIPDTDVANLSTAYGKDTFVLSEKEVAIKPSKVVLGGGPGRARAGDPQNPAAHVEKPRARAKTEEAEEGDLDSGASEDVKVEDDGSGSVEA